MNREIRLRTVWRPEAGSSDVGQRGQVTRRYLRDAIHRLRTVTTAKNALARVVEERILFHIIRPIRNGYGSTSRAVRFDRVLVAR